MDGYQDRIRKRIIRAREEKGYSPEELALRTGLSAKQIRRIENGESRNPHLSTIRAIAEATDKDVAWIRPDLKAEENVLQQQLTEISGWMQALTEAVVPLLEREEAEQLQRLAGNAPPPCEAPPESQSSPGDQPRDA